MLVGFRIIRDIDIDTDIYRYRSVNTMFVGLTVVGCVMINVTLLFFVLSSRKFSGIVKNDTA